MKLVQHTNASLDITNHVLLVNFLFKPPVSIKRKMMSLTISLKINVYFFKKYLY